MFEKQSGEKRSLSADHKQASAAKDKAETERDVAVARVDELEAELAGLQGEADDHKSAWEKELKARERAEAKAKKLERERDKAARSNDELKRDLAAAHAAVEQSQTDGGDESDALAQAEAARQQMEAERDKALQRAEVLEEALLVLRDRPQSEDAAGTSKRASGRTKKNGADTSSEDDRLHALRTATDNPIVVNRSGSKRKRAAASEEAADEAGQAERHGNRIPSQVRATYEKAGTGQARFCMIADQSATGAKLEIARAKIGSAIDDVAVGDKLTLMFSIGQERTSVPCEVQWVEESSCGVKYRGQFRTEIVKSQKKFDSAAAASKSKKDSAKSKKSAKWFARA